MGVSTGASVTVGGGKQSKIHHFQLLLLQLYFVPWIVTFWPRSSKFVHHPFKVNKTAGPITSLHHKSNMSCFPYRLLKVCFQTAVYTSGVLLSVLCSHSDQRFSTGAMTGIKEQFWGSAGWCTEDLRHTNGSSFWGKRWPEVLQRVRWTSEVCQNIRCPCPSHLKKLFLSSCGVCNILTPKCSITARASNTRDDYWKIGCPNVLHASMIHNDVNGVHISPRTARWRDAVKVA